MMMLSGQSMKQVWIDIKIASDTNCVDILS